MITFPCGGTALAAFEINTYSCGGTALAVFEIKPCGWTALAAFKIYTYSCGRTVFVVFNLNPYPFISVEQGNKGQILSGTGEQIQYKGTGNIRIFFQFWGNWGTGQFISAEQGKSHPGGASFGVHYSFHIDKLHLGNLSFPVLLS